MADRIGSPVNIEINWVVPADILSQGTAYYDQITIFRSSSENSGYAQVAQVPSNDGTGNFINSYIDLTQTAATKDFFYYLITFNKTSLPASASKYFPTFFSLTPRELRLVNQLRVYLSQFIGCKLTDEDLRQGIMLALQAFNILPPITAFTIDTFPRDYEPLLLTGAQIYSLLFRYLSVSITDFGYGDQGLALTIDRGAKVKGAVDDLTKLYTNLVTVAKLEFAEGPSGVGTLQLPISLGGNLNRGILNVLDVFTALGR